MRIIQISSRADIGGGPRYIDIIINSLPDKYNFYIACPTDKPYYNLWLENNKIHDIEEIPHRKFSIMSLIKLHKFVKKNKIEIVHANGKGAGVYGRLLKLFSPKLKIVYTFHGIHIDEYSKIAKKVYLWYERIMARLTNKIISVSEGEYEKGISLKLFNSKNTAIIYNAVSQPKIKIALEKDCFYIITVSRFDYQKNMGFAYEIAKRLSEYDKIKFLWIGDGPDKEELELNAVNENLNNIIFTGFISPNEVFDYFNMANIYLSTSRWEGLPFSLIEACSFGIPIVSTNVVGNSELVRDNYNGFLFEETDIEKAIESIKLLYENLDLYNVMRKNSYELYQEKFTISKFINAHIKVYNSL